MKVLAVGCGIFTLFITAYINKFKIKKLIIMAFFLCIPFMTEIDFFYNPNDYHIVAKAHYTFNYLQIFTIIFLIEILRRIKSIKLEKDLIFLIILNLICIIGITQSKNKIAGFYDYVRYFQITIMYIYFSRIFEFKKYNKMLLECLIIGNAIQLLIGILQKIKGGPLGLTILGEGINVFRQGVEGYEKGFSGTFAHPGPMALYALIILVLSLYSKKINSNFKILGISTATIIIVLAAGRSCIGIMLIVYLIYGIKRKQMKLKSSILVILGGVLVIIGISIFKEKIQVVILRFTGSDSLQQLDNRIEHLEVGMRYLKQNFTLGVGLNNYLDNTLWDFPISFKENFLLWNPIHNSFLQLAVEIGIFGVISFVIFIRTSFKNIPKKFRETELNNKFKLSIFIIYFIYSIQGWAVLQTRSLLMIILIGSFITNERINILNDGK